MPKREYRIEIAFLGLLWRESEVCRYYVESLPIEAFSELHTKLIFTSIKRLYHQIHEIPQIDSILIDLEENCTEGTDINAVSELALNIDMYKHAINAEHIENKFLELAKLRLRKLVSSQLSNPAVDLSDIQSALKDVESIGIRDNEKSSFAERLQKWASMLSIDGRKRIPTGFTSLDKSLKGGMLPGEYSVIIGYTNSGKSFIASNIAINAIRFGYTVAHFTNENPIPIVTSRYAVGLSETPLPELEKNGRRLYPDLPPENALIKVTESIIQSRLREFSFDRSLHIFSLFGANATVSAIDEQLDKLKQYHDINPDLVIVDDLDNMVGNMSMNHRSNEEQRLAETSQGLNQLADKRNIVLWVPAQLKHAEAFKTSVRLGKGESRSHRAKAEIPDNSFYNLQTEEEKDPSDRSYPSSSLKHKRARNMPIVSHMIPLEHRYDICRIFDKTSLTAPADMDHEFFK